MAGVHKITPAGLKLAAKFLDREAKGLLTPDGFMTLPIGDGGARMAALKLKRDGLAEAQWRMVAGGNGRIMRLTDAGRAAAQFAILKGAVKITLLASAPTLDGIRDQIARFYGGEEKRVWAVGGPEYIVLQPSGAQIEGVRVILKGGRYRFEGVS